jgi:hypothetical protein
VEPILVDTRLDLGEFSDLMDHRLGVVAGQFMTTAATGVRLALERLADLLGWNQRSPCLAMSWLPSAFLLAGRGRGSPLHSNRIGRRGLGRVSGIELETVLKIPEPALKERKAILVRLDKRKDRRLQLRGCRLP